MNSEAPKFASRSAAESAVPDGPRFHRQQIVRYGPLASLIVPAVSGILALILLYGSQSTWRGIIGLTAALLALPTLPIVGIPVTAGPTRWLVAIISSVALWLFLGHVAARRASRRMASSWPEWRQQWWRLAAGSWMGSLLGLGLAGAFLLLLN